MVDKLTTRCDYLLMDGDLIECVSTRSRMMINKEYKDILCGIHKDKKIYLIKTGQGNTIHRIGNFKLGFVGSNSMIMRFCQYSNDVKHIPFTDFRESFVAI